MIIKIVKTRIAENSRKLSSHYVVYQVPNIFLPTPVFFSNFPHHHSPPSLLIRKPYIHIGDKKSLLSFTLHTSNETFFLHVLPCSQIDTTPQSNRSHASIRFYQPTIVAIDIAVDPFLCILFHLTFLHFSVCRLKLSASPLPHHIPLTHLTHMPVTIIFKLSSYT